MKIYASYSDAMDLADYAGQDAWIHCYDNKHNVDCYVRVISHIPTQPSKSDYIYTVNWVTEDNLTDIYNLYDNPMELITDTYTRNLSDFDIQSRTVETSAELFSDIYESDLEQFDKYIGKDFWILAETQFGYKYYIRVLSREGLSMEIQTIPVERISGEWYGEYSADRYIDDMYHKERTSADAWKLIQPLDVLTDDEVVDILHQNYDKEETEE